MASGATATSSSSGRPRRSASSGRSSRARAPARRDHRSRRERLRGRGLRNVKFLPFILFTLPAGVWVDRLRRKPILVIGDLGRFAVLGSIPIAYFADALTLWQLYAVAFLVGVFTVFFDVAYQSYLPSLVDREQLLEGNSKLEISRSTSQLAGPGSAACSWSSHRSVCRAGRCYQLSHVGDVPAADPKTRGAAARAGDDRRRRSRACGSS